MSTYFYFCELLTVADLARLLRRKPQGVARDVARRPESLPPFIRSGKTPLWPRQPQQPSLAEMLEAANSSGPHRARV